MIRETSEGLYRDTEETPYWQVTIYVDGRRRRVSTGEREHSKALKKAHQIRQEILRKKARKTLQQPFVQNLDEWIELKSQTWAKGTTYDVKVKTKILKEYFADSTVAEIDEESWEGFLGFMARTLPERKIGKIQDYLSSFLKFQFQKGLCARIPVLRDPDEESEIGRVLHPEEIDALLTVCKTDKLRLQILMQLKMGMRAGEVLKLAKDRIDWRTKVIRLRAEETKTRKARVVPIHPEVFDLLKTQASASEGIWLFPGRQDSTVSETAQGNKSAFRTLLEDAGVQCRRHDLRHTCATQFARDGVAPMIACRILGMSLAVYDKIYCKPNEDDLKAAFDTPKKGHDRI